MNRIKQKLRRPLEGFILLFGRDFYGRLVTLHWIKRLKSSSSYEPEVDALSRLVERGDMCFDIGGNVGQYTIALSKLVGEGGTVFVFEASAFTGKILKRVLAEFQLRNVVVENVAVGDKNGAVQFVTLARQDSPAPDFPASHIKGTSEDVSTGGEEIVRMIKMDDYVESKKIRNLSFIKCDVEGAELLVFRGCAKTLSEFRPTILCEVDAEWEKRYDYNPAEFIKFLEGFGYVMFIYDPLSKMLEKVIDGAGKGASNYFFIHKDNVASIL